MSKPVRVEWTETVDELEAGYRAERNVERRKRLGALWRVQAGDRVADAAAGAGVGLRTVERWLGWYRTEGLAGVLRRVPGHGATGQPHRLSAEQQQAMLARCAAGEFHTFEQARDWVEAEYGVVYQPDGFASSLRRLGVRPKVPRPRAERANPAAQEAWRTGE